MAGTSQYTYEPWRPATFDWLQQYRDVFTQVSLQFNLLGYSWMTPQRLYGPIAKENSGYNYDPPTMQQRDRMALRFMYFGPFHTSDSISDMYNSPCV